MTFPSICSATYYEMVQTLDKNLSQDKYLEDSFLERRSILLVAGLVLVLALAVLVVSVVSAFRFHLVFFVFFLAF